MIPKNNHLIFLMLGLGLYISPAVLGITDHYIDSRILFISGIVIISSSIWEYGNAGTTKWSTILTVLSGVVIIISGLLLGRLGHIRLFWVGLLIGVPLVLLKIREIMHE